MVHVLRSRRQLLWTWLLFAGIWYLACRNLAVHWSANPIYSYGWLVPIFGLYAAWCRWETRPAPGSPIVAGGWFAALAALAFLPTWVFAQPNPDWSLVGWVLSAEVVVMTLGAIAWAGGFSWLRHFAFPACFIFAAVPWPHVVELPLTLGLMRRVAGFTVELLNVAGIAAVQHGNVIEVRTGLLGVDEACSGVRSLQAALTASLFLGELYRFKVSRRVALVLISLLAALITNVARTFFLSWKAASAGLASIENWHDPAGFTILAVCFAIVWAVALFLARMDSSPEPAGQRSPAHRLPMGFTAGLTGWFLLVLTATEIWFYDGGKPPQSRWSLVPPPASEAIEIGEAVENQLQCDRTTASIWREPDGGRWLLYFLEWRPGPVRSRVLARVHRPEICLSATGLKLVKDRGPLVVEAGGLSLSFRAYTFEQGGNLLFVYYGLWQNRTERGLSRGPLSESEHIAGMQAVLWRERNLGQQVAELAATGYANAEQADAGFQAAIRKLLVKKEASLSAD